jgi:hypothetical protein
MKEFFATTFFAEFSGVLLLAMMMAERGQSRT